MYVCLHAASHWHEVSSKRWFTLCRALWDHPTGSAAQVLTNLFPMVGKKARLEQWWSSIKFIGDGCSESKCKTIDTDSLIAPEAQANSNERTAKIFVYHCSIVPNPEHPSGRSQCKSQNGTGNRPSWKTIVKLHNAAVALKNSERPLPDIFVGVPT